MTPPPPWIILLGKGGSVFHATSALLRELGVPFPLHAIVSPRADYLPPDPALRPFLRTLPWTTREHFFDRLESLAAESPTPPAVFSWFNRLIPASFLRPGRLVCNQHPSLLPAFPGLHAWDQALAAGVQVTGTTIHLVDPGIDTGRILLQHALRLDPRLDPALLRHRLFLLQVYQACNFFAALAAGHFDCARHTLLSPPWPETPFFSPHPPASPQDLLPLLPSLLP